jgi:hypothetical protein
MVMWWGLIRTQRQAQKLILSPSPTANTILLCFNRTQCGVVTCLLTGHNTLRIHRHLMGLTNSPLCRRFGAEEQTSTQVLCECKALVSLRHAYLVSFFLDSEDVKSLSLGAIWNFSKEQGSLDLASDYGASKGRLKA